DSLNAILFVPVPQSLYRFAGACLRHIPFLLKRSWSLLLVLMGFAGFVVVNQGIVVGMRGRMTDRGPFDRMCCVWLTGIGKRGQVTVPITWRCCIFRNCSTFLLSRRASWAYMPSTLCRCGASLSRVFVSPEMQSTLS